MDQTFCTFPRHGQPAQLPLPLQFETPPSVANHINQIETWVIYNLKNTILSNVHFENQLYGSVNSFHASIFPMRRRFMTIPQGIIRRALDADEVAEVMAEVMAASFGSTGALHESRDTPGIEVEKSIPDFTTVKVRPQPGHIRDHHIVCIVEIKRKNTGEGQAIDQMMGYMRKAAQHPSRDEELRGYLIMANTVIPFWVEGEGEDVDVRQGDAFDMFAAGDRLTTELCEIAIRNWNV